MPMRFTLAGREIHLTKDSVEAAVSGKSPEPIRKYWVRIAEDDFPIKQVVSLAANIPIAAFISTDAYRILTRLGFEVRQ
jgi:hypothetical protein